MDQMGVMDHPTTFDEVIKRGFPLAHLDMLKKARLARRSARAKRGAESKVAALPAATVVQSRKDATSGFTASEQAAFKNAVVSLVEDGTYVALVQNHMDMSHDMHGSMGETGLYRFLAWHRRYLVEFERELQRADAIARPGSTEPLRVPYWRWQDPFPAWLAGFLPANDPSSGTPPDARKTAPPPDKANAADLDIIVNQFQIQQTGLPNENVYVKFTYGLEGWGQRPDGNTLPAHNHGHAWVGGIMNNTSTSPTDPVFWLHHAEVDRLWEIWRQTNPAPGPPLTGSDRIMDPWAESYDDLLDMSILGYTYDSATP